MIALAFLAGVLLGVAHLRMWQGGVEALVARRQPSRRVQLLAVLSAGLRYLMTFLAGICLIRLASLDPFALGAGLLVSIFTYRAVMIARLARGD